MFDIFGRKRREEERRRRAEQENRLRRTRLLDAPSSPRPAANDSQMNPASPSGMVLSAISPSYGGSDHSPSDSCTSSSSYSDSGSSCSVGDSGGGGGGD